MEEMENQRVRLIESVAAAVKDVYPSLRMKQEHSEDIEKKPLEMKMKNRISANPLE